MKGSPPEYVTGSDDPYAMATGGKREREPNRFKSQSGYSSVLRLPWLAARWVDPKLAITLPLQYTASAECKSRSRLSRHSLH
ncbi:hypothetical protein [Synechococcus sp. PCC 6312]|uniref:hypothetical protein n=1 Tax=Synechococcus sp. (strain ATCC 27167 / PCC 6312) TaxID=195253 RepID=UPI00029F3907|nr:hypothetical protein [Synechococcus sp. PCC 6312]AFY61940.1 hypothetical protein Syn6312_2876 [Synechococcus sp. PCC 6312]